MSKTTNTNPSKLSTKKIQPPKWSYDPVRAKQSLSLDKSGQPPAKLPNPGMAAAKQYFEQVGKPKLPAPPTVPVKKSEDPMTLKEKMDKAKELMVYKGTPLTYNPAEFKELRELIFPSQVAISPGTYFAGGTKPRPFTEEEKKEVEKYASMFFLGDSPDSSGYTPGFPGIIPFVAPSITETGGIYKGVEKGRHQLNRGWGHHQGGQDLSGTNPNLKDLKYKGLPNKVDAEEYGNYPLIPTKEGDLSQLEIAADIKKKYFDILQSQGSPEAIQRFRTDPHVLNVMGLSPYGIKRGDVDQTIDNIYASKLMTRQSNANLQNVLKALEKNPKALENYRNYLYSLRGITQTTKPEAQRKKDNAELQKLLSFNNIPMKKIGSDTDTRIRPILTRIQNNLQLK